MGQYIKAYPTLNEVNFGELDAPRVAYVEDIETAIFSSGLSHVEDLHEEYYKSLLEELMERIQALEDGKRGSGVFLAVAEYEKLIATGHAVDEDGQAITYDSGATYYTYDEEEGVVDIIYPEIDGEGFLPLEKATIDREDFLDLSDYAYIDSDDFLAFYEEEAPEVYPYIDGDVLETQITIDEDDYLDISKFGQIDKEGYLIIE